MCTREINIHDMNLVTLGGAEIREALLNIEYKAFKDGPQIESIVVVQAKACLCPQDVTDIISNDSRKAVIEALKIKLQ